MGMNEFVGLNDCGSVISRGKPMSADVTFVFSLWSLGRFLDPLPLRPPQQEEETQPDEPSALSNMKVPITLLQDVPMSPCQDSFPAPSRLNLDMGTWGHAQPLAAVPSSSS